MIILNSQQTTDPLKHKNSTNTTEQYCVHSHIGDLNAWLISTYQLHLHVLACFVTYHQGLAKAVVQWVIWTPWNGLWFYTLITKRYTLTWLLGHPGTRSWLRPAVSLNIVFHSDTMSSCFFALPLQPVKSSNVLLPPPLPFKGSDGKMRLTIPLWHQHNLKQNKINMFFAKVTLLWHVFIG